ncbi:Hit1p KNAG_0B00290 [Huiozyma naganishii CBS 8797]|uniref:HIT-type domain-containing protein n=1 Tax=Huiozyma naganishii (strain ATCC MYA-139 / BCRC 22969 / CBS 8797 / KCTC 17520 / NBRC 10181 / NCYC 3082 / Yp74L-3) TaxID=1071383 RepID=J7RG31_HUIN7|nr:hypothetical protein KNAG_0B00290 [Kazachstania naganishii CBS 8797]CCK68478.1 hypothetical protein KNAG_0B00290 [Kazachstania naganishii CBS 8797]
MNSKNGTCEICLEGDAKYRCPKCRIRYCSLRCFKNEEKHSHKDEETKTLDGPVIKEQSTATTEDTLANGRTLKDPMFNELYEKTPELRGLLQYNTVKFHLAKVHKILTSSGNGDLTSEGRKQLAIDYLNTLRYGGVHFNEAVEEFCQICSDKLD